MSTLEYQISYRRHLPHFQPPGAALFVTSRLVDSIPAEVHRQLLAEAEAVEAILALIHDPQERAERAYRERRRLFGKWDRALDTGQTGPFWLGDSRVAALVAESLHYRDGKVYDLDAFCIMPNHLHTVHTPLLKADNETYHALPAIMHSLKLYTARRANSLLGRRGGFWQHENYDHVVRNEEEWRRIIMYVVNNPVKAGLFNIGRNGHGRIVSILCRTNC
jgi:REP element-mobilizing transposase RayT